MSAHELLREAQAAGLTLRIEPPDVLVVRGPRGPRERLLPAIKEAKPALLELLSTRPDPRMALYREWLAGIQEPLAFVTLDEDQIQQAVAAGIVAPDLAERSVLLLYRSPLGAVGLLAVPREKYDGFELLRALEAVARTH
jgi:hypothetical protein